MDSDEKVDPISPRPWKWGETAHGFAVVDANGQQVAEFGFDSVAEANAQFVADLTQPPTTIADPDTRQTFDYQREQVRDLESKAMQETINYQREQIRDLESRLSSIAILARARTGEG